MELILETILKKKQPSGLKVDSSFPLNYTEKCQVLVGYIHAYFYRLYFHSQLRYICFHQILVQLIMMGDGLGLGLTVDSDSNNFDDWTDHYLIYWLRCRI